MTEYRLTHRERQCLELSACGYLEREIANILQISPHTVRVHMVNAKKRLGAKNKSHSIILALLSGELDLESISKSKNFISGNPIHSED